MRVLRSLEGHFDDFHIAVAAHEDVCYDFLVALVNSNLALFGKWKVSPLEQHVFGAQIENCSGELLESVEVVYVVCCLAGFAHDKVCLGDVGSDEICDWEKFVDQGFRGVLRKKLRAAGRDHHLFDAC